MFLMLGRPRANNKCSKNDFFSGLYWFEKVNAFGIDTRENWPLWPKAQKPHIFAGASRFF